MALTSIQNGEIGEYICAMRLLKMGIPCRIVNMGTVDIVAEDQGILWRIQVKSSVVKGNRRANDTNMSYQFNTSKGGKKIPFSKEDCDIMAFVATDKELVVFAPMPKLTKQVTKRMSPKRFTLDESMKTWLDCMKYFNCH